MHIAEPGLSLPRKAEGWPFDLSRPHRRRCATLKALALTRSYPQLLGDLKVCLQPYRYLRCTDEIYRKSHHVLRSRRSGIAQLGRHVEEAKLPRLGGRRHTPHNRSSAPNLDRTRGHQPPALCQLRRQNTDDRRGVIAYRVLGGSG